MNLTEVLEKLFLAPMSGKQELHRRVTAFVVKNRHRSQLWVSLDGSFIPDVVRIISDALTLIPSITQPVTTQLTTNVLAKCL